MIQTCVECLLRLRIKVHCNLRWLEPVYLNIIVNILFLRILVSSLPLFPLKVKKKKERKGIMVFSSLKSFSLLYFSSFWAICFNEGD